VLPPETGDQVQAALDLLQALRIVVDPRGVVAERSPRLHELVIGLLELGGVLAERGVEARELRERLPHRAHPLRDRVVARIEDLVRVRGAPRELRGMREAGGLGLELLVLARLEARTLDLLELEAQEIRAALELSPAARALLDLAPHGLQRP